MGEMDIDIDESALEQAQQALGTTTEEESVNRALATAASASAARRMDAAARLAASSARCDSRSTQPWIFDGTTSIGNGESTATMSSMISMRPSSGSTIASHSASLTGLVESTLTMSSILCLRSGWQ